MQHTTLASHGDTGWCGAYPELVCPRGLGIKSLDNQPGGYAKGSGTVLSSNIWCQNSPKDILSNPDRRGDGLGEGLVSEAGTEDRDAALGCVGPPGVYTGVSFFVAFWNKKK